MLCTCTLLASLHISDASSNAHIFAGVYNDLGSGSNIDLCVITKGNVEYKRNLEYLQDKLFQRKFPVDFKARPATVIKAKNLLTLSDVVIEDVEPEAMDTS
jgi:20S proteasome subunit beta 2